MVKKSCFYLLAFVLKWTSEVSLRPFCGPGDVRAAFLCGAAQMAMFTALQSEYLLQLTGLADPTVTANGAVGKTNSCNEAGSVCEAAEICFSLKPTQIWGEEGVKGRWVYRKELFWHSALFWWMLNVLCHLMEGLAHDDLRGFLQEMMQTWCLGKADTQLFMPVMVRTPWQSLKQNADAAADFWRD